MAIHPLAVVDSQANVHPDATIGPFCVVGAHAHIEANVELKNNVTVFGRSRIGAGTVIYPNAVIASDPQFLAFEGEDSEVVVGENCKIHEAVTISKGTAKGGMKTIIGDNCLLMTQSHIGHDCEVANDVILGNGVALAGHVKVGRKAIISAMSGVHQFASVGELTFVGGMSGIRKDAPPYLMVEGTPAEPRNVNLVGLRRDGWSEEDVRAVREMFRIMWYDRGGRTVNEVLADLPHTDLYKCQAVQNLSHWMESHLSVSIKGRLQEAHR